MYRTPLLGALVILAAACSEPAGTAPGEQAAAGAPDRPPHAQLNRDIAALRAATAGFHRFEVAEAAGYDAQFPPGCFTSADGGMGYHYLNEGLVGTLEVTKPQLVLYEPQADGSLRLVGFEYLVPGLQTDPPPTLFGQDFRWHPVFEVWVLHVWAWRHNPAGMFADWNPTVSCRHATTVASAHH